MHFLQRSIPYKKAMTKSSFAVTFFACLLFTVRAPLHTCTARGSLQPRKKAVVGKSQVFAGDLPALLDVGPV